MVNETKVYAGKITMPEETNGHPPALKSVRRDRLEIGFLAFEFDSEGGLMIEATDGDIVTLSPWHLDEIIDWAGDAKAYREKKLAPQAVTILTTELGIPHVTTELGVPHMAP